MNRKFNAVIFNALTRIKAKDEEVWRTSENGKHYKIETETGEIKTGLGELNGKVAKKAFALTVSDFEKEAKRQGSNLTVGDIENYVESSYGARHLGDKISRFIDNAPESMKVQDETVYRGLWFENRWSCLDFIDEHSEGSTIVSRQDGLSWTTDMNVAKEFSENASDYSVMLINEDKKKNAISISNIADTPASSSEVLYSSSTDFKVKRVEIKGNTAYLYVTEAEKNKKYKATDSFTTDEEIWRSDEDGRHFRLETETGTITAGFGGKMNGVKIQSKEDGGGGSVETSKRMTPDTSKQCLTDMREFHKRLAESDNSVYGKPEDIDEKVREQYRKDMAFKTDVDGNPWDYVEKCTAEEYMKMGWPQRTSHYVDYDSYKEFVLQHNPENYAADDSIVGAFKRYEIGANANGYGKGKGARLAFDEETGMSKFIDTHPEMHYNGGTLYRGIQTNKAGLAELEKAMKTGEPITMRGPSSWTAEESVAKDFAENTLRKARNGQQVIFREVGEKERNAMPFPYSSQHWMKQYEVVYSNSARFKIKGMKNEGGVIYVDVEEQ